LRQHRIRELLIRRSGLPANLAGRIDRVLSLERADNIGDRNAKFGQLVRTDPEAHGVLSRAKNLSLADTVQAPYRIVEVDIGIVREVVRIVRSLWRIQGDHREWSRGRLLERDPVVVHL